jgi:hypothetical protein
LNFFGTASSRNQTSQAFTVTFTNGVTANFTQSIIDQFALQNSSEEKTASACAYRDLSNGTKVNRTFNHHHYLFLLSSAKTRKSLTPPNNSNVLGLAFTLTFPLGLSVNQGLEF